MGVNEFRRENKMDEQLVELLVWKKEEGRDVRRKREDHLWGYLRTRTKTGISGGGSPPLGVRKVRETGREYTKGDQRAKKLQKIKEDEL